MKLKMFDKQIKKLEEAKKLATDNKVVGMIDTEISKLRNKKNLVKKLTNRQKMFDQTLNPFIKNKKITWENKDKKLSVVEGFFQKEKMFEIKKGISIFTLKVVSKKLSKYKKSHSSPHLIQLQKKAEAIFSSF